MDPQLTYTVFAGERQLAAGDLPTILRRTKRHVDRGGEPVLIFEDRTGRQVEFDFAGSLDEVLSREAPDKPRGGPGRPKLGVVSREVTLLPRQWEWLEQQPNGISAALRRIVDEARKTNPERERARTAIDAANRFMTAMAGNRAGFEEATRALYAGDHARVRSLTRRWPADIRKHLARWLGPG